VAVAASRRFACNALPEPAQGRTHGVSCECGSLRANRAASGAGVGASCRAKFSKFGRVTSAVLESVHILVTDINDRAGFAMLTTRHPSIRDSWHRISLTNGGRSVGMVRVRTKGHGVFNFSFIAFLSTFLYCT
jgi:hypothetical protein